MRIRVALRATTVALLVSAGGLVTATTASAADAPGTWQAVSTTSPNNSAIAGHISTASDRDWYRFAIAKPATVRVELTMLPQNYVMGLYGASGALLASHPQSGTGFEVVTRKLAAGTYFVQVRSQSGGFSATQPYQLRFRVLPPRRLVILSDGAEFDPEGHLNFVGEIYNNATATKRAIDVIATIYNASSNVIGSYTGRAFVPVLAPGNTTPFRIVDKNAPAAAAYYSLALSAVTTTAVPVTGLRAAPGQAHTVGALRHFPGSVTNAGTLSARNVRAAVVMYDSSGAVRYVGTDWLSPSTLAPSATGQYDVVFDHWSGVNRAMLFTAGIR